MLYSVVIPVYNSSSILDELYNRIKLEFENEINADYEIVFVDDFSRDGSFSVIKRLAAMDERVKYVRLAKNHGQQKAVLCGIDHTSGDYIITMDDDLQHPPEEIPKLIAKMESDPNIDVVIGSYDSKKHSGIRLLGTKMLDVLSDKVFKKDKDLKLTSFRLMKSFVADNLSELNLHAPTVGHCLLMVEGSIVNETVHHAERKVGKSNYRFSHLVKTFMGNVYANSDLPLRVVGSLGIVSFIVSVALAIFYFMRYLIGNIHVSGWTTLVILVLLMNGLSLFSMGIMGRYMMFMIEEAKNLPKYSVKETNASKTRGKE